MTEQLTRQQRRKLERQDNKMAEWKRQREGLPPKDLMKPIMPGLQSMEYARGFEAGATHASKEAVFTCYAAAAIAAHKHLGFGKLRIQRFIQAMDKIVVASIDDRNVVDQLEKETGYKLTLRGRDGSLTEVDDF